MTHQLTKWQADYIANAYRELESGRTRKQIEAFKLHVQDKKLLDVGCGPGVFLIGVSADHPKQLVGVDLNDQFLAVAREELQRRSVTEATVLKATATDLPFAKESFDIVTCFLVLPHVPDDKAALAELGRVLKTGGTLAISGHDKGFPLRYVKRFRFKPLLMYVWSFIYALTRKKIVRNTLQDYKKICRDLAEVGFEVEHVILPRKSLGMVATYQIRAVKKAGSRP